MQQLTRRGFISGAASLALTAHSRFASAIPSIPLRRKETSGLLLIGTQTAATSKGIYAWSLDYASGELKQIGLAAQADNPTFLTLNPSGEMVFVANELNQYEGKSSGAVSSYTLDRKNARLIKINQVPSLGVGTCHVSVDHTSRCLFAANYSGGSAASFQIADDGKLSPAVSFEQYTGHSADRDRQQAPHAHRVTVSPDNRFLLVNDLGLDAIHIYRLDSASAKLTPNDPPAWKSAPGAGPRALRFHPNGRWVYCVNEIASTVNLLYWNHRSGILETHQEIGLRDPQFKGMSAASEIAIDHRGRFAYVADRFDDIVVTFSIAPRDGKLALLDRIHCGGRVPRHITLDPTGKWLLVANQASDNIAVFDRNPMNGELAKTSTSYPISKPQCLVFA